MSKTEEQEAAEVWADDVPGKISAGDIPAHATTLEIAEFAFLAGIAWRDANPKKSMLIMESGYIDDSGKRHVTDRIIKEEEI